MEEWLWSVVQAKGDVSIENSAYCRDHQLMDHVTTHNCREDTKEEMSRTNPAGVSSSTYSELSTSSSSSSKSAGPQALPTPESTRPSSRNSTKSSPLAFAQADSASAVDKVPAVQVQADVPVWEYSRKEKEESEGKTEDAQRGTMRYHFNPEMKPLVFPAIEIMTPGSDM